MKIQSSVSKVKLIFICLLFFQCEQSELKKNDKQIIVFVIDKLSKPLPPPPNNVTDTIIQDRVIDSLNKMQMQIVLNPVMESSITDIEDNELSVDYMNLIDLTSSKVLIKDLDGIKSNKGHIINIADTLKMKESYDFDTLDIYYSFSKIWYNSDNSKAILEVGISRSRVSGYSTILCLKKLKNKWYIEHRIPTSIW